VTLATVLAFARTQAQTDSNGITDANGIIWANEALNDLHRRLVTAGVDASQVQESYRDGAANTGTYLYPTDMLFLKAIELNYTDTTANNYVVANQTDVSNISSNSVSFSWLRGNALRSAPLFDDRGDWFEIFPTPTANDNVSQLIRMFYYLQPTLYAATADIVNYPENLDAAILGWRIASSFLYSLGEGRIQDGDKFIAKYEERVKQYIATLSRGVQQPLQVNPIALDGFEF
jgi:hypothetical protein